MKLTIMTADEQIITLEIDRDESVITSIITQYPNLMLLLFDSDYLILFSKSMIN